MVTGLRRKSRKQEIGEEPRADINVKKACEMNWRTGRLLLLL